MAFCRRCGRALMGGFRVCPGCHTPVLRQIVAAAGSPAVPPAASLRDAAAQKCARCARDLAAEPPDLRSCPSCRTPL